VRRIPGRDAFSVIKRAWLVGSLCWLVFVVIFVSRTVPDAFLLLGIACFPLIVGPMLFYTYHFIRYGTLRQSRTWKSFREAVDAHPSQSKIIFMVVVVVILAVAVILDMQ